MVAHRVVQRLEIIKVDKQQRVLAAVANAHNQGLAQPLPQQAAVRQAGQTIVEGEIPDLLLLRLGRGDIPYEDQDARNALDRGGRSRQLPPEHLSVLPLQTDFQILAA